MAGQSETPTPQTPQTPEGSGLFERILNFIERVGNKLPHPIILFFILAGLTIVASWLVSAAGVTVEHPGTGETVEAVNLISRYGFERIVTEAVDNFVGFAPLGVVLVAMLGVGVAEKSGLINSVLKSLILGAPMKLLTVAVVLVGILSSVATDAGYVVVVPLGAIIFAAKGRHPMVGLAAAFAGVSGGFSANLIITSLDPLLTELTRDAAETWVDSYPMAPSVNLWFMMASTIIISAVGAIVTEKIVAPRFGEYTGDYKPELEPLNNQEKSGIKAAVITLIILLALLLVMAVPADGLLRDDEGSLTSMQAPLMGGMVPIIMVLFLLPGIAYGYAAKTVKNSTDVAKYMSEAMSDMGGYVALAFAAGQFVKYFEWSQIGTILAVAGADFLQAIEFTGIPLLIAFVIVAGFINLFVGSASAKWAIMAPVFVPMFMELGYAPELTQMAYRVGDSVTNIITPLMPYFAVIIAFAKRFDEKVGIGTLISTMLPYSIVFLITWTIMLILWYALNLPIGPGGQMFV
ncbi:AbgT family transporter [Natranaerobius thermophilus]|uniref:AbgT putative transporter n=1 Tax=Natranaerobius thermophilus (strain ATCC BAA-1301 / DSM 18059 / JW/NM-WN-LF) TaxID=457570 RepID=B2A3N7_NATTJ|nr:AbgT family transporter [Natranaerobius thermophilus]ACB83663.1 AbgT putative transporter [Natranaerobius thermophilus JW/NM-WN-LF]